MKDSANQSERRDGEVRPGLPRPLLRLKANGFLWIGDPHLTCVRPGRRVEDDFLPVVLDKIEQARKIAEEKDLLMVFLGDMTDNATAKKAGTAKVVEDTNRILSGFARAMSFRPCITIPGNHDKDEVRLTDGTTLGTMRDLGLIHVMEPGGAFAIVEVAGQKIGLGGSPYGEEIPRDVRTAFPEPVDRVIWITHSQFEFDVKNNFLDKVFEIKGCDMVVNGHDHTTMRPQCAGDTWWHNPGNLTRMSVDCAEHEPSVWEWHPGLPPDQMHRHKLRVNQAVFDLRGLQVEADVKAAHSIEQERSKSLFAELLVADNGMEMERSATGDVLAEDIERYTAQASEMSEAAKLMLRNLHLRAPERLKM